MCKESMQWEIINNKKKPPARSLFYRNPDEKHVFFFYLALIALKLSKAPFTSKQVPSQEA